MAIGGPPAFRRELPEGFCVMPFIGMYVSTNGQLGPCCVYDGALGSAADGLVDTFESDDWDALRQAFLDGQPVPGCWKCFQPDRDAGSTQRELRNAERLERVVTSTETGVEIRQPARPTYLDARLSNLCNLKCRSCWHGSSSKWFADARQLGINVGESAEIRSYATPDAARQAIWPLIDGLDQLYFAGGEPLLMPEHYDLLEALVEADRTDIELSYNTNLTVTSQAGRSVFDLWEQFPRVLVEASVDGIGERGRLIRSGFDWDILVANVAELRRRCPSATVRFGVTVSVLNVLHLPDLLRGLLDECGADPELMRVHSLSVPECYRTQVLPSAMKHRAASQIERFTDGLPDHSDLRPQLAGVLSFMFGEQRPADLVGLHRRVADLDRLRNESTREVLPELVPALRFTTARRVANKVGRLLERRSQPLAKK
jgi:hypothetical protein